MQVWQKAMAFVVMGLVALMASTWAITAYVVRNNEMDRCDLLMQRARHAAALELVSKAQECGRALEALQIHLTQTCDKATEARLAELGQRVAAALQPKPKYELYGQDGGAIAIDQDGVVLTPQTEPVV